MKKLIMALSISALIIAGAGCGASPPPNGLTPGKLGKTFPKTLLGNLNLTGLSKV